MRNRLAPGRTKYIDSFKLNQPLESMGIAEVIESDIQGYKVGDLVTGMLPWQELSLMHPEQLTHLDDHGMPISASLGVLGYPGLTAYVGIQLAELKPGQTVYVSSAAGAVGSLAGQLAKLQGCYVVGSAGSDAKVTYLRDELKFDAAFNYKNYKDYGVALKQYCPKGIDVNFENVGGRMLEAAIDHLNEFGRVILCGAISQYNLRKALVGPKNFNLISKKSARFIPYIVTDYAHLLPEFKQKIALLCQKKQLSYSETLIEGIESAWPAFISLFSGKNTGKMLVTVGSDN